MKNLHGLTLAGLTALSLGCGEKDSRIGAVENLNPITAKDTVHLVLSFESAGLINYREAEKTKNQLSVERAIGNLETAREFMTKDHNRWCATTYRLGKLYSWYESNQEFAGYYLSELKRSDIPSCKTLADNLDGVLKQEIK